MTAPTAEVDPTLAGVVDRFLGRLEEPMAEIRSRVGRPDSDFLDPDGNVDIEARRENDKLAVEAVERLNEAATDWDRITRKAHSLGLDDHVVVALGHIADNRKGVVDTSKGMPIDVEALPETVDGLREEFFYATDIAERIMKYWGNPLPPYLIQYEASGATIFPSKGPGNVKIENVLAEPKGWSYRGVIYAEFDNGQGVDVKLTEKGKPRWVEATPPDKPQSYSKTLLGYRNYHAGPEDFAATRYMEVDFVGGGAEDGRIVPARTDSQMFAARASLALLRRSNSSLPHVELPAPKDEFSQGLVDLLARSAINAFLPPRQVSRVHAENRRFGGYRVKFVETNPRDNLIEDLEVGELAVYLGAVGASGPDLREGVYKKLNEMGESQKIKDRFAAAQARQSGLDAALGSLLRDIG